MRDYLQRLLLNRLRRTEPAKPPSGVEEKTYSSPIVPERFGERPDNYMAFFREHNEGLAWYEWMHRGRLDQHEAFQAWFNFVDRIKPIASIAEFGCGYAVGYADFFSDRRYLGIDMSEQAVEWCKANRARPGHDFIVGDFISDDPGERCDLVLSQGTIDNTYDMDAFLRAAVAASRKWIYVTAYRGYFAELTEHQYQLVTEQGVFYNKLSPVQAYHTLRKAGAHSVVIHPHFTGARADTPGHPFETVIIARVDRE
jgi:SAM-dependent methyltransferase